MIRKTFLFGCIVFVFGFCELIFVQQMAKGRPVQRAYKDGRQLFLEASIAISEERFEDAHAMAERLIGDYAGDYQIRTYLHLYEYTFCLVEEDWRNDVLPVDPQVPDCIKKKVQAMMAKRDKTVLDLVKLVAVGDKEICGGEFPVGYLEEIVRRFPQSPWADWAEWLLIENREYRPREKYQDKNYEERTKLLARDMYEAGKKFIEKHPDSPRVPGILHMMANERFLISNNEQARQEAIRLSRRIIEEYPLADTLCASARLRLKMLGEDVYQEQEGASEERDRIISRFYSHQFDLLEFKRSVAPYLSMKNELESEGQKGAVLENNAPGETAPVTEERTVKGGSHKSRHWQVIGYVLVPALIGLTIAGTLLAKRKPGGTRR